MLRAELHRCEDERWAERREWAEKLYAMAAERDRARETARQALAALAVEVLRANRERLAR